MSITIETVANEAAKTSVKEVLGEAKRLGFKVSNAKSELSAEDAERLYNHIIGAEIISVAVDADKPLEIEKVETDIKEKDDKPKVDKKKSITRVQKAKPNITKEENIIQNTVQERKGLRIISINQPNSNNLEEKKEVEATPPAPTKIVANKTDVVENNEPVQEEKKEAETTPIKLDRLKANIPVGSTMTKSAIASSIRIIRKTDSEELKAKISKETKEVREAREASKILADLQKAEKVKTKVKKATKETKHQKNVKEHLISVDREIGNTDYDEEQNEIMLIDLNERMDIQVDEDERVKKTVVTERVKINKYSPWMKEGSISRIKRKSGRHYSSQEREDRKLEKADILVLPEEIRVYEFAEKAGLELGSVLGKLFLLGVKVLKNDFLDKDTIEILANEFGIDVKLRSENLEVVEAEITEEELETRAPVVTIMGHVDHGKTSLLDYIRNSRVVKNEAGGITQHIGAYMVEKNNKWISFIDTPGHEAFANMRSRGAKVTDIAIIVIAADDGVKTQTIEALNHAKDAGVQIIIAMNKMDKPNVNPDKLKAECAELGFNPQEWGGEYDFIPISAKSGQGIDVLLETVLIQAELLDLKASKIAPPKAIVLEGSQHKGKGSVATIIMQQGVLKVGQSIVADIAFGKVRALYDDLGNKIDELAPSGVAQITGLSEVPLAGSVLQVVENDSIARELASKRLTYIRQKQFSKSTKVTYDELSDVILKGQLKTLPIILRADTQGSLEAIKDSLEKLSNEEVEVSLISYGIGAITQSDIDLAIASSHCIVLGFNVKPNNEIKALAKKLSINLKTHSIIYDLLDEVKKVIIQLMSAIMHEEVVGMLSVRNTFSVAKIGVIAGCMVIDGKVERNLNARVLRGGVNIWSGKISSLKRFKDDIKEVTKGYECGVMLDGFNDIQENDELEIFKEIEKKREII